MGIPAIAVSLVTKGEGDHYNAAAAFIARLVKQVWRNGLPEDTFLNVNVPDLPAAKILAPLVTTQGKRSYEGTIVDKVDPRGRNYYWIGTVDLNFLDIEGSDFYAVSRNHISITPLHPDLTNYRTLEELRGWELS